MSLQRVNDLSHVFRSRIKGIAAAMLESDEGVEESLAIAIGGLLLALDEARQDLLTLQTEVGTPSLSLATKEWLTEWLRTEEEESKEKRMTLATGVLDDVETNEMLDDLNSGEDDE